MSEYIGFTIIAHHIPCFIATLAQKHDQFTVPRHTINGFCLDIDTLVAIASPYYY